MSLHFSYHSIFYRATKWETWRHTSRPRCARSCLTTARINTEGVCTSNGTHYTRKEVVDSTNAGNRWKTQADGYEATIEAINYCPKSNCVAKPYIKTNPDSTKKDNLENLDSC